MTKLLTAPKRSLFSLLFCVAAPILYGCLASSGPLIDPASAVVDPRLLGDWTVTDKDGSISTLTFGRGTIKGQMMADEVDIDADKKKAVQRQHYVFVVSPLNGRQYMDDLSNQEPLQPKDVYLIVRYRISGKSLEIRLGDVDTEKRLIAAGRIQGKDGTAQAASLARYLAKNTGDDLFPEKNATKFFRQVGGRIKPPHNQSR